MRQFYVYILASTSRTLYIGVTNDLVRRVYEHKHAQTDGFTSWYQITQLVYYEMTTDVQSALQREKQLKGWRRSKKVWLIETQNPTWLDLSSEWYDETPHVERTDSSTGSE